MKSFSEINQFLNDNAQDIINCSDYDNHSESFDNV